MQLPVAGNEGGRLGPDRRLLSFGEGADGEVYVLTKDVEGPKGDYRQGYKLVAAQQGRSSAPATHVFS